MMISPWKVLLVFVLAWISKEIFEIVLAFDFTKHVFNHTPGPCHLVPGIEHGSEDIEIMDDGIALITTGLRYQEHRKHSPLYAGVQGRVAWFDMNNPAAGASWVHIQAQPDIVQSFNPHGISIYQHPDTGGVTVFVVNHPVNNPEDSVEKFTWDKTKKHLVHQQTITNGIFKFINDLKATSADSFYVTNQRYTMNRWTQFLETFTRRAWGEVVYWRNRKARVVANGLIDPNGINLSKDKRYLYVAHCLAHSMSVFQVQSDNSLSFIKRHLLFTKPDNLDVDEEGNVWTGAHPVGVELYHYMEDPRKPAPSQVLRMKMEGPDLVSTTEVYSSDSSQGLHGSTIGAYHRGGLLIGTIQHKLMYCTVKYLD